MDGDDPGNSLLAPKGFEWDGRKNATNLAKHGIDFDDAKEIFDAPLLLQPSDRGDEKRWKAIGVVEGRVIAVVFTRRGDIIRLISARRARTNEEGSYRDAQTRRSAQGKD